MAQVKRVRQVRRERAGRRETRSVRRGAVWFGSDASVVRSCDSCGVAVGVVVVFAVAVAVAVRGAHALR